MKKTAFYLSFAIFGFFNFYFLHFYKISIVIQTQFVMSVCAVGITIADWRYNASYAHIMQQYNAQIITGSKHKKKLVHHECRLKVLVTSSN